MKILTDLYNREFGDIKTVGLGDSLNDLPMLEAVDVPIIVQKSNGRYDPKIQLSNLTYADGAGPPGWNSSILKLFTNFDKEAIIKNRI